MYIGIFCDNLFKKTVFFGNLPVLCKRRVIIVRSNVSGFAAAVSAAHKAEIRSALEHIEIHAAAF